MQPVEPLRFAVIGAGALGGLYGGLLARHGFEVHFLLHSDAAHVREHGLRIESPLGDAHLREVCVHDTAETLPPCDVTIVGLKTTKNDLLAKLLPPPTREGGTVLVLQNGLNVEADSAAVVGPDRLLGGCCFLCSNKVGPGHIRHLDYGRIVFGRYAPADQPPAGIDPLVERVAAALQAAGIDAVATSDLWLARWRKLMWNIPFNGLSVVLDASTKDLIEDPAATALARTLMEEVAAASAANGRPQPSDAIEKTLEHTKQMVPYDSSMRLDYLAGRPMEIEAIMGNPLRAAEQADVLVPSLRMLYRQLQFLQARATAAQA
jgi:2-dehydropantoate 2-reductase